MLDSDLAELYGVETRRLNEQVARNADRFPEDFMFRLNENEFESLMSQIATSKRGGRRKLPYMFSEHGVLMLSSVLSSKVAIQVNIRIMRVYVRLRVVLSVHQELSAKIDALESSVENNKEDVALIFQALRQLMEPTEVKERVRIGFHQKEEGAPSSSFAS